jgi:uncharacterized protein (DUF302 family)
MRGDARTGKQRYAACSTSHREQAMTPCNPPIVVALDFETAVGELSRAICSEGMSILARIDVRDHFWRVLGRDIRPYVILEAWSPETAIDTLQRRLDIGVFLPTRFSVYPLDDGRTAIAVSETATAGNISAGEDPGTARLAALVDREYVRTGCILARLRHTLPGNSPTMVNTRADGPGLGDR